MNSPSRRSASNVYVERSITATLRLLRLLLTTGRRLGGRGHRPARAKMIESFAITPCPTHPCIPRRGDVSSWADAVRGPPRAPAGPIDYRATDRASRQPRHAVPAERPAIRPNTLPAISPDPPG